MFGIWPAAPLNVSCTTLSGDSTLDIDAVLTSHSFATRFTKRSFCWGSKLSNIKEGLARFIHRAFETTVPQRVGGAGFGGVGDAAVGV